MIRYILALFLVGCAAPEEPDSAIPCDFVSTHPAAAALQDLADARVAAGLPGLVLGVRSAGGVAIVAAGMADIEDAVPLNACHVHPMASIGKTWTAAQVLLEAERGALDLDAPVGTYLSERTLRRLPRIDAVTLRHLLEHSSGLPDFNSDLAYIGAEFDRDWDHIDPMHGIDAIRGSAGAFRPGRGYLYTDTAYELLALVLDAVTGDRIAATREDIHVPLAMAHTTQPRPHAGDPPGRVNAYWEIGGGRLENISAMQSKYDRQVIGAGNVRSTAGDAMVFLEAVVHGPLLEDRSRDQMQTWNSHSLDDEGYAYGLGLSRREVGGRVLVGHTGGDVGAGSLLLTDRREPLTLVALTNVGMFLGGPLGAQFDDRLLEEMVEATSR